MTFVPLLAALFAVDLLAAMSPGPNFVVVMQAAVREPSRNALAVVAGIVAANLIWCLSVVLGLRALFDAAPALYAAVKVAGGVYLLYLGVSLWRNRGGTGHLLPDRIFPYTAFARGLLTNLSNPKSVVYFSSVFAVFLAPGNPLWVIAAATGIVLFNTVLWYGGVAVAFGRPGVRQRYAVAERFLNKFAGALMAAFGARLILSRT